MRGLGHSQPALGRELFRAELLADAGAEDLGAAAGQGPQARLLQGQQGVRDAQSGLVGQVGDLHRGEGLEMHLRAQLFNAPEHVEIKGEGQVRVAAADDVDLGDGLVGPLLDLAQDLLQGHLIGPRLPGLAAEGAELAPIDADIGVVDMLVVDIEGLAPVQPLPHHLGQGPDPQQIGALKQRQAVFPVQTDSPRPPCRRCLAARGPENWEAP